ncbi:MAG: hypothetical protein ACOH5I_07650 [Oligoflexus sp.]
MRIVYFLAILAMTSCRSDSGADGDGNGGAFLSQQDSTTLSSILSREGIESPAEVATICTEKADSLEYFQTVIAYRAKSGCRFGQAGNGDATQGQLQAVETSHARLRLPVNSLLCELKVESRENSPVVASDDLFFTLNRMIIFGSNQAITNTLRKEEERIIRWSFPDVRGQAFNTTNSITYCHRDSFFCIFNRANDNPFVRVTLENQAFADIAYELVGQQEADARIVVTGDNGNNDCSHSDLLLQVQMKYLTISPGGIQ